MKHKIKIKSGGPSAHQCTGVLSTMFYPRCFCGWDGAWMLSEVSAVEEGKKHVTNEQVEPGSGSERKQR